MKLEACDLRFSIEDKVILNRINFYIESSEIVSIIGPNGAGKTTLLKCLNCVLADFKGKIILDGKDIKDCSRKTISKKVGLMQQEFHSIYDYKVFEIIEMGRYLSDISPKKFEQIITYLNFHNLLNCYINDISTGERQLTQIAMILYQDPAIFLLDEPVSHLDPYYRRIIIRTIRDLKLQGKLVISIFHDINTALHISDRILVLDTGEVKFFGTPGELLQTTILETVFRSKPAIFQEQDRFFVDFF